MYYNVYDSQACSVESYDQLEDAVKLVASNLVREEQMGRFIDAEPNGRWAVYDGLLVKVVWIETDNGEPVYLPRSYLATAQNDPNIFTGHASG